MPGRAATSRFSRKVSDGKISRSCGTKPSPAMLRRCGASVEMSLPCRLILPPCRLVWPMMVASSVVLPTPLRPMTRKRFAFRQPQIDVLDHHRLAVAGGDAVEFERGRFRVLSHVRLAIGLLPR